MIAPLAYRVTLLLAAGIAVAVGAMAWRRRPRPGALPLVVNMAAVTVWLLATVLSWSTADPDAMMFWRKVTYVGIALAIPALFVFALKYAGLEEHVTWRLLAALAVPAVLINGFVWTNPGHGLVWATATTPGTPATFEYGPVFWALIGYSYLLVVGAVTLLFRSALGARSFYRGQLALILLGTLSPLLANLTFLLTDVPYDLAPLAFAVTGSAFAVALRRYRFLDLPPVVRERLVAEMDDLVLVTDDEGRIADVNPATRELFDTEDLLGTPAAGLLGVDPLDAIVEQPLELPEGEGPRFYDVTVSDIDTRRGGPVGRLVVLRDVTELTTREQELTLLRQVMARYIRHNLRNDLNVVLGQAEHLAELTDGDRTAVAERIGRTVDRIVESTEKVRLAQRVVEGESRRRRFDLVAEVEDVLADVREESPDVTIEASLPDAAWVRASDFTGTAIRNVLENACEHNSGPDPNVSVRLETGEPMTALHVEDDGPGIPPGELAALEDGAESALTHGSGIGLYLVDWIVDRSGGELSFGTDPTRVTVRLPRGERPPRSSAETAHAETEGA